MWVSELWRYPVKSMAGETMHTVDIGEHGVAGDRILQVRDQRGRVLTARSCPRLLGLHATLDPDSDALVEERPWTDPWVAAAVESAGGTGAHLVRSEGDERFDILPLLVATDGAIDAFGHDRRRLRPNIVVGGVAGLAERSWEGHALRSGGVVIGVRDLRQRCIMTTFDPSTLAQDVEVLKGIHRRFGGSLALNAYVVRGGMLSVGDPVELIET
jgi:uncharacterized protein YcbX